MRRIALFAGIAVLILAAVLGGAYYAFVLKFSAKPPAADYPKPATALEAQKQDLDYFGKLMALDRAFTPQARALADKRLEELQALPEPLPPPKFKVALLQIFALADNGHSRMSAAAPTDHAVLVEPIRVTRFSEGFFVMRAKEPYRALLGARIEAIDGMAFEQVLARLETLRGGTESWRRENATSLILLHDILYGLGVVKDPARASWTLRQTDGQIITAELIATPFGKRLNLPPNTRYLSPEPLKGDSPDWISYSPASGTLPESLSNLRNRFSLISVPDSCAVYIRLQAIMDSDEQKIAPFLETTASSLKAHPPCAAIVDLRGNGGGDYTKAWGFTHALPNLVTPGGRLYVLTDPYTFSAAITAAAFLKEAGGDRVTIIGEPVGDRLSFHAEGGSACLPNSGLCLNFQVGKHDYEKPCQGSDCFWLNWFYPVRVKTLAPDIAIPRSFADWNQGRDGAYEAALKAIRGSSHR